MERERKRLVWLLFFSFGIAVGAYAAWSSRDRVGLPLTGLGILLLLMAWVVELRTSRVPRN